MLTSNPGTSASSDDGSPVGALNNSASPQGTQKRPRGRPRKQPETKKLEPIVITDDNNSTSPQGTQKRPRGRPRKYPETKKMEPIVITNDNCSAPSNNVNVEDESEDDSSSSSSSSDDDYYEPEETAESVVYGPNFRRIWRKSEKPLCIVGSATFHATPCHLVRLKPSDREELAAARLNPSHNLNKTNCVVIPAAAFAQQFPTLVANYFSGNTRIVPNAKSDAEITNAAARATICHQFRKSKVRVDAKPIFNDMMGDPNAHKDGNYFLDNKGTKKKLGDDSDDDDKFGLPDEYGTSNTSESEEDKKYGASSSSSDEDGFEEVKAAAKKKRKLL